MQPAQLAASTAIDRAIAALTYDHIEQIPLDGGPVLVNDQVPLLQRSIGADLIRIEAAMSAKGKTLLSAIAASIDEAVVALAEASQALRQVLSDDFQIAREIVDSDAVINVYAACEWDELNDDGKAWVAAIVAEARRRSGSSSAQPHNHNQSQSNLKPAPFFLNEKTVRDVLEGKPGKACDLVPLSPEKLADQPGPYCGPCPIPKAAENGSQNEPARVAPAKAEPSAPVESPKLDRPDTNVTSGTSSAPLSVTGTAPRSEEVQPAARESSRSGPAEGSESCTASAAVRSLHSSTVAVEPPPAAETASVGPDQLGGPVTSKKRSVDRLDVIRAVAANLERREKMGLPARAPRIPRAPIAERRPAKAIKLPPLPVEQRRARVAAAIAFLKRQCILVDICDRDAQIRRYRVSGRRESMLAEDVIQLAIDKGLDANV